MKTLKELIAWKSDWDKMRCHTDHGEQIGLLLDQLITVQTALEFVTGGWYFGQFHGREAIFDEYDMLYFTDATPELAEFLRAREASK